MKKIIGMPKSKIRFETHQAGRGGWSKWVYPKASYLFKCCDCSLVHEIQFRVFKEKNRKGKDFEVHQVKDKMIRPAFRARRAIIGFKKIK